jgi:hypothetical protein
MHGPINVKSPNNTSKWQMGFNSAFKGLNKITNNFNLVNEKTLAHRKAVASNTNNLNLQHTSNIGY